MEQRAKKHTFHDNETPRRRAVVFTMCLRTDFQLAPCPMRTAGYQALEETSRTCYYRDTNATHAKENRPEVHLIRRIRRTTMMVFPYLLFSKHDKTGHVSDDQDAQQQNAKKKKKTCTRGTKLHKDLFHTKSCVQNSVSATGLQNNDDKVANGKCTHESDCSTIRCTRRRVLPDPRRKKRHLQEPKERECHDECCFTALRPHVRSPLQMKCVSGEHHRQTRLSG